MNTRSIIGSENILFNAINRIVGTNEEMITYVRHVEEVSRSYCISPNKVTRRVIRISNDDHILFRRTYFGDRSPVMSHKDVMDNLSNIGYFVHDGDVIYYNSPVHGIVQIGIRSQHMGNGIFEYSWIFRVY